MKPSMCLEMVFVDRPFVERMAEAARLGYQAVEFWDWKNKDIDAIAGEAKRLGLEIAAFSGNRKHSLLDPARRAGLIHEMSEVFEVARRLRCRHIMMLSDVLQADGSAAPVPDLSRQAQQESIVDSLRDLAAQIEGKELTLLLEPLNTVLDHRGCFLYSSDAAIAVLERVNHPQVRLLYDVYHMSMMGEDAAREIARKARWIGYLNAADMPRRHQPGSGKIPWNAVRDALRRHGYQGFIGMECSPQGSDEEAVRSSLGVFS